MIVFHSGCLERIASAAERAYPEECCGLLIGRREDAIRVTAVAESDNVAPSQRTRRFEVDPALRFLLMRRLRGSRDDIVGHYHSHPEAPAAPSAYDASMVFEPDLIWVIVAVAAGRAGEIRCWRWDPAAGRFRRSVHHTQSDCRNGLD
jgi:proteasome lid subunit RPN8/RPN11